ncbi:MAG: hypothetical protein U9Q82_02930, partial [Chloroflexota bacterium]|nr:hypothetical protein [Chloroflexota bacterium]
FEPVAQTAAEFEQLLKTSQGQDDYLMAKLSIAKQKQGLSLDPDEILDFIQTPKLGGELSLDNLRKMKFVDSVNAAGQIHEQIKDLPAGTQITNVNVIDA